MKLHIIGILAILAVMKGAGASARDGADKTCSQTDIAKYGRPVMFDRRAGIAFGVSAPQTTFHKGSDAVVYIWLSNHTETRKSYNACCEATFLQIIDVFDSSGHVLETAVEARLRSLGRKSDRSIAACSCSALRMVEPGTCRVIDQGTLNRKDAAYSLTFGHYTIRERNQRDADQSTRTGDGLTINIDEH
jgi:hypothetical protein